MSSEAASTARAKDVWSFATESTQSNVKSCLLQLLTSPSPRTILSKVVDVIVAIAGRDPVFTVNTDDEDDDGSSVQNHTFTWNELLPFVMQIASNGDSVHRECALIPIAKLAEISDISFLRKQLPVLRNILIQALETGAEIHIRQTGLSALISILLNGEDDEHSQCKIQSH